MIDAAVVDATTRRRGSSSTFAADFHKVPTPIALQRMARPTVRRHVLRSFTRLTALFVSDVVTLFAMRYLIRGARDGGWLGDRVADLLYQLVPPGTYPPVPLLVAVVLGLAVLGNYASGDYRRSAARLTGGAAIGFALMFWARVWVDFRFAALLGFLLTTAAVSIALTVARLGIDFAVAQLRPSGRARTLFVSSPGHGEADVRAPMFRRNGALDIVGFISTGTTRESGAIAHIDDLVGAIHRHRVETLIISGSVDADTFTAVVDFGTLAGCEVFSVPRLKHQGIVKPQLVWRQGIPLVQLTRPSLKGRQLFVKRCLDIALSGALLLLLAPLFGLIALLIRLDSAGPVFFRQDRAGYSGKRFRMLKFRTMCRDADAQKKQLAHLNHTADPRLFKIPNDPRVTRVGALLRRWSLDELPQLLNVLMGHMTLVGPRPFFESDMSSYEEHHFRRLGAKPGITGLWQVSGRSSVVDFEEVVRLDQEYINNWSPWLDVKILARTFPAVLRRTGAF